MAKRIRVVTLEERQVESWAVRIRSAVEQSVACIVATGVLLTECRAALPHGAFLQATQRAGLSPRVAQMFMAIARHPTIANASNYAHLPAAYNTLSDLSRLPPLELEAAIVEGAVHPAMTRSEVKGLMFHRQTRTGPVQMLSNGQQTLYTTLVVDPPWQYTHDFIRGSAFDHYDPMSLDELAELELPAADAAHLYLWVTNSHLLEGHSLLDAWGFEYRTMLTWVKPQIGMGLYWRSVTEHVLFATRGRLETQRNDLRNCFEASRGRHSEKPDLFYELVEQASPGPYVDLFARRLRPGWAAWGNQIEQGA